jgi:hypothetical protein
MNAACANGEGDVNTVIDYQLHSASFSDGHSSFGFFIKLQSRHPLLAELNERSSAQTKQFNLFCM